MSAVTGPEEIANLIAGYLSVNAESVVVEDSRTLFDFASAHYSVAPERERCLLQIWSEERNIVRRAVAAEVKNGILKLSVMRFGQAKPARLEICPKTQRRSASSLRAVRATYQRALERALEHVFPGWIIERLTTTSDLEHSFSAVYARALLRRGQQRIAVVGCGAEELQSTIDNAVAVAVLWLDYCRENLSGKGHVGTATLFVPEGRALTAQLRLSHLNREAANWQLFALDEHSGDVAELDLATELNLSTHLVHCFRREQVLERFAGAVARMNALCPQAQPVAVSTSAISFRFHGLEFARATFEAGAHFRMVERIVFGAAPAEYELTEETEPLLRQLIELLRQKRGGRDHTHPFYRLQPERWLQSIVERDLSLLDAQLDPAMFYPQVPAFAAADRAVIDLLGILRDGRLAVIELKAAEDFHLPIQGLDYWARVRWLLRRGEFAASGYFPGRELSERDPVLILAAPALHLHTTTATMLRYLSPEVEWRLYGVDERWRDGVRVVFRKQSGAL
ncbi:MAG: hypothetical protein P4M01_04670 [Acidobacteriota bacterium]|nr:hypothetical protein [Acidobacteriota bacterium]